MTRIALLCPTRGRPEQCRRMVESVHNTSSTDVVIFLFIADDDESWCEYQKLDDPKIHRGLLNIIRVPAWPTVQSWNCHIKGLVKDGVTDLFMLSADDIIFSTPGWDQALLEHYDNLKEKVHVYSLQDSRDADGTPHPFVTREYIEALGYAFPPIFLHWWVDSWTVAIGKSCGVFTHLKDYLLIHDKPSDRGQLDETHSRIRRMGWHERDAYVAKTMDHVLKAEMVRLDNYLRKREA